MPAEKNTTIVHLVIEAGPLKGQRHTVPQAGLQLGRDRTNELLILDDMLSRTHSRFFFRANRLWVSDLKSANGTEVNGLFVDNQALSPGDIVVIGSTRIRVRHNGLEGIPGFWARLFRRRGAPDPSLVPTSTPAASSPRMTFLRNVACVVLVAWWLFLAYSLCLPPPGQPAPQVPVTVEDAPAEAERLSTGDPRTLAEDNSAEVDFAPIEPDTASLSPMHKIRNRIAGLLLAEEYDRAAAVLTRYGAAAVTPQERADLISLRQYTAAVQAANVRIAEAIGAEAGHLIQLRRGNTNLAFRVMVVAGSRIQGTITAPSGEKSIVIDVTKLHPDDRLLWLGTPQTPEENALCCALARKQGSIANAERYARNAGVLAEAYAESLAQAPASATGVAP